jgi:3'(2'),5'-bisphosphate nucleotidase
VDDGSGAGFRVSSDSLALLLGQIAVTAGQPIMDICRRGFCTALKADASPVTDADLAAEHLIVEHLARQLPGVPVVAEECVASGRVPDIGNRFVLVDPLDGTREFVAGRTEFTVNLALIDNGRPVAGAVYAPALEQLWFAGETCRTMTIAPGAVLDAARSRTVRVRVPPPKLTVLVSRSHLDPETEAYLSQFAMLERRALGSSMKFCLIAQGEADLYPRLGSICEWDTAAGHAVVVAAGGEVSTPDGQPLNYGNRAAGFRHQVGFVAFGGFRAKDRASIGELS